MTSDYGLHQNWYYGLIICLFCVLAAVVTIPYLNAVNYYYEDSYTYLGLAQSLETGKYEIYGYNHNKYLPGYPAAIVAVHTFSKWMIPSGWISQSELTWDRSAKIVSLISRLLLIPAVFLLAFRLEGFQAALWAMLFTVFHVYNILYSVLVYSEPLASLLIVLAFWRMSCNPETGGAVWTGIAAWVRPEAYLIIPARFISTLVNYRHAKSWIHFIVFSTIVLLILCPWFIRNYMEFGSVFGSSYFQEVAHNQHSGLAFLSNYGYVLWPIGLILSLTGIFAVIRKHLAWPLIFFLLLHMLMHIWWWWNVDRFIMQVLPLLHVFSGIGVAFILQRIRAKMVQMIIILSIIGHLALQAWITGVPLFLNEIQRSVVYQETIRFVNQVKTPVGVISSDPGMVQFHSHHQAIGAWLDLQKSPQEFLFIKYFNERARFLIVSPVYAMDHRFLSLDLDLETKWTCLVQDGTQYFQYELMVQKIQTFNGPRFQYEPDYTAMFALRTPKIQQVDASIYQIKCRAVPLTLGKKFDGYLIPREVLKEPFDIRVDLLQ